MVGAAIQPRSQLCSWRCRLSRRLPGSARHLPSCLPGNSCHLPSRLPVSACHLPSCLPGNACHLPSRLPGSARRLARGCLSRRHSFSPIVFDVCICPFRVRFHRIASLFADFAVAHGKSIIFYWEVEVKMLRLTCPQRVAPRATLGSASTDIPRRSDGNVTATRIALRFVAD